jgi:hypothetical protein
LLAPQGKVFQILKLNSFPDHKAERIGIVFDSDDPKTSFSQIINLFIRLEFFSLFNFLDDAIKMHRFIVLNGIDGRKYVMDRLFTDGAGFQWPFWPVSSWPEPVVPPVEVPSPVIVPVIAVIVAVPVIWVVLISLIILIVHLKILAFNPR